MKKLLVLSGLVLLAAVLLINRLLVPISTGLNIVICAFAACLMVIGIVMKNDKGKR